MLNSCFGPITLLVDEAQCPFSPYPLALRGKQFQVDGRYGITLPLFPVRHAAVTVELVLNGAQNALRANIETGEKLALISFYSDIERIKLSIGTVGDLPGVRYDYLPYGLRLEVAAEARLEELRFVVAWRRLQDEMEEALFTWFAADPCLGE